jgi:hypothetical protein
MTGLDELVAFVRRCLDEDERVALAAQASGTPPWVNRVYAESDGYNTGSIKDASGYTVVHVEDQTPGFATAEHIARWDPARVLAEVKAKRRILDLYEAACAEVRSFVTADQRAAARVAQFQLEAVITALAQPCAGREGWREEWQASAPA